MYAYIKGAALEKGEQCLSRTPQCGGWMKVLNECVNHCCGRGHAKDPNCLRPTDQAVRSDKAFPWAEGVDDRVDL